MATAAAPFRLPSVIGGVWLAALLLTLYGAPSVRDWLRTAGDGHEAGWRPMLGDLLVRMSDATGLARLRLALEGAERPTEAARPLAVPTPPPRLPPPGASPRPVRRVILVGASTIQFHLGAELERRLPRRHPGVSVVRLGKLSTGLTRPDVFDWPATVRTLLAQHRPDLLIANFGGNDAQPMVLGDGRVARFGRPDWDQTYRARVQEIVQIGRAAGAEVLLLGMSATRDASLSRRMARINTLTEAAARQTGARYLSIWDIGTDANGRYQDAAVVGGVAIRTRLADGKHFSRVGAAWAADLIVTRLAAVFALPIVGGAYAAP